MELRDRGRRLGAALLAGLLGLCAPAGAVIRVGQTADFSGIAATGVQEAAEGARLYLDMVNAQGGVAGQQIELLSLDDHFEPQRAAENARQLIARGVLALFLTRGSPHAQAVLPLLSQYRLPLIAPCSGAMFLHQPVQPWVFNVRASYQREAERVVQHHLSQGMTRLAIVQVDDSFGNDAIQGALRALKAASLEPFVHLRYARDKPDMAAVVAALKERVPQAVVFLGTGQSVSDGILAMRAAGIGAQVSTLSNNASAGFSRALGDKGRGVIVGQVFPYERGQSVALVREAQALARRKGLAQLTPASIEGFAAAKLLVEALRRSGKEPSRESLAHALEGLQGYDLGGLELSYSPRSHSGLDYVDLSIIGADGKFWR